MAFNWSMQRIPLPVDEDGEQIKLPKAERERFAQYVADYARQRSIKGNGAGQKLNGKKWSGPAGKYTKKYAKIKGKKSPVDLSLSSEMLSNLKGLQEKAAAFIRIGCDSSSISGKVMGNRKGTYGKQISGTTSKARDFMQVTNAEMVALFNKFNKDDDGQDS